MVWLCCFLLFVRFYITVGHHEHEHGHQSDGPDHESRRILNGREIVDTRPYMVYLRPAKPQLDPNWLCGGVIIHPRYILTSAACIEDVLHFFIISGTHNWVPQKQTNECIKNGATKAIWKCVPKTYRFDGNSFNNIHWMANDIAVVMTAEPISFEKRIKGCDFIPRAIRFNNDNPDLENPGTKASVAGWGSIAEFNDAADIPIEPDAQPVVRSALNTPQLMEADVEIEDKGSCKNLWHERYHHIIEEHMICGKSTKNTEIKEACMENQMECRELAFSAEVGGTLRRHHKKTLDVRLLRSLAKAKSLRRARKKSLRREGKEVGGFCENDHGGPLIAGQGKTAMLIGIISAYRTLNHSKRCMGPFLYTSVYKNRNLINCAINRQLGIACRTVLRESSTVLDQETIQWDGAKRMPEKPKKRSRHHKKKSWKRYTDYPMKLMRMKAELDRSDTTQDRTTQDSTGTPSKENDGLSIVFKRRRSHRRRRGGIHGDVKRRSIPPTAKKVRRPKN